MTYTRRLAFLSLLDSIIVMTSIYFVLLILRIDLRVFISPTILITMLTLLTFHHIYAFIFRLYHKAWEYASVGELTAIVKAVTLSIFSTAIVQLIVIHDIYFRVLILTWMMHILLIGGSRFCWRVFRDSYYKPKTQKKRTLIIGAGAAGTMVAKQLLLSTDSDLEPIGFIDDDSRKINLDYFGLPVFGNVREINRIVETQKIELILIAIPSLTKKELNLIVDQCTKTKVRTQIMPKIEDLMTGKVSVTSFRDVEVEDLLGRDQLNWTYKVFQQNWPEKRFLLLVRVGQLDQKFAGK